MGPGYIAVIIFIISLILFMLEKINRSLVAIMGASLLIILGVLTQSEAISYIDFNTIGLLTGMMMIVAVIKRTGIFEYLGIMAIKLSNAKPLRIILFLSITTAVLSALLDNVTTVLILVPITLAITDIIKINPMPFIIAEILSANIGGAATLIGDPPNIMIGSISHLTFTDFIFNNGPIVIIVFFVNILILSFIYRRDLFATKIDEHILDSLDASKTITDTKLLKKSLIIFAITIFIFIIHGSVDMELATIAITLGTFMLIFCKIEPDQILAEVDWVTLAFLAGLFAIVGGLDKTGIISSLGEKLLSFSRGSLTLTSTFTVWLSALVGSFVGSVPFTAIMGPIIKHLGQSFSEIEPLWWSLSLGVCLGGNATLIGTPCNLIAANIARKNNQNISFLKYLIVAFPLTMISILICNIYIYLRYFLF